MVKKTFLRFDERTKLFGEKIGNHIRFYALKVLT